MTRIIALPAALRDGADLDAANAAVRAGRATLDWSGVRDAPMLTLERLLRALDLGTHADALGLESVPEPLIAPVLAILLAGRDLDDARPGQSERGAADHPWPPADPLAEGRETTAAIGAGHELPDTPPEQTPWPDRTAHDADTGPRRPASPRALRALLEQAVLRDLLGPVDGPEEEVIEGSVRERYLVGMLAPRGQALEPEQDEEMALGGSAGGDEGTPDAAPAQQRSLFPSSLGITFCVLPEVTALRLTCRWGRYERGPSATRTNADGEPKQVWRRAQVANTATIPLREGPIEPWAVAPEQPAVGVQGLVRRLRGDWIVTLFLVNGQEEPERLRDEAWLFQPELAVEALDTGWAGAAIFRRRPRPHAPSPRPGWRAEEDALAMAYRDQVEFAVGHGVAVRVTVAPEDPQRATRIASCVVPSYEVPKTTPPASADIPALAGLVLDMRLLAEIPDEELPRALEVLPDAYADWLARQRLRAGAPTRDLLPFSHAADAALADCARALARIREGLAALNQPQVAEAFRFMNRAMWLQRTRSLFAEAARRGAPRPLAEVDVPANRTWFPFQLAFILMNLPALADPHHRDRAESPEAYADLLWFPTGGGKTEAYLGLTAFTLAIRRLQGEVAGHDGMHGLAVLMRYTLRLLTLQQFQRAAALICACEAIRREAIAAGSSTWGAAPFRVGLWVGQRLTPTRTAQSIEALKGLRGASAAGSGSPAVLTSCPWCGTPIDPRLQMRAEPVASGRGRTLVFCGDSAGDCPFSEARAPGEGLPVLVVDEEIYRLLPSLLIATVDKFAQMPWNGATAMLFGRVAGYCPRHGFRSPELDDSDYHPARGDLPEARTIPHPPLRPPDLIIQDELHLISGPLGTLVGLYETAIDRLCTWEVEGCPVRPKVIASTATIRQAGEQVRNLFLRRVAIFPPQGLDAGDTFFAIPRAPSDAHPGRRYLGICAPGRRLKAVLIRVYVAHLAAAQQLYEEYGAAADPWMTLVGYFNSIRELGGMRRLIEDDVRSRLRRTGERHLAARRVIRLEELTSRRGSGEIPALLNRLELPFEPSRARAAGVRAAPANEPLDVLLATNMISVGVDVKRLGLMVVSGQPKSTAEYIQATSRVGRSAPGLVCTVLNWARPRDLSHYERFEHYHATFYQQVEALSVTPFAPRAVDRGLAALLVSLVRLAEPRFTENGGAARISRDDPAVRDALAAIAERAEAIGDAEALPAVRERLGRCLEEWLARAQAPGPQRLGYSDDRDDVTNGLLQRAGAGPWQTFTLLNSLREVEQTVALVHNDEGMDG